MTNWKEIGYRIETDIRNKLKKTSEGGIEKLLPKKEGFLFFKRKKNLEKNLKLLEKTVPYIEEKANLILEALGDMVKNFNLWESNNYAGGDGMCHIYLQREEEANTRMNNINQEVKDYMKQNHENVVVPERNELIESYNGSLYPAKAERFWKALPLRFKENKKTIKDYLKE
jgi:hypothetical protein|tara:strand:- start:4044 stop:4556 length:513 start_codon:yes stop_codon:yes gene_type:complete